MAKNKIRIPMSQAGLVRYMDEFRSKIEFSPGSVVILIILIIILILILHSIGMRLIGLG